MVDYSYIKISEIPNETTDPLGQLAIEREGENYRITFNSIKFSFFNDSLLTGNARVSTPPVGIASDRIPNTAWVLNELGSLGLTPATNSAYGTVRTNGNTSTPVVYLKEEIDSFNSSVRSVPTGGTGGNTPVSARTSLEAAKSGVNADITALSALNSVPTVIQNYVLSLFPPGFTIFWAGGAVPGGWALFDGRALVRASNPVLFSVFGTVYGNGDGSNLQFNLPNWIDRFPLIGGGVGVSGNNIVLGSLGGSNNFILTTNQLPTHNHSVAIDNGGIHTHTGSISADPGHTHGGSTDGQGNHAHNIQFNNPNNAPTSGGTSKLIPGSGQNISTDANGLHAHNLSTTQNGGHTHTVSVNASAAHSHTASSGNVGANLPIDNRPSFVGLPVIVRLG